MGHTTAVVRGLPKGTTKSQVEDHFNQSIDTNSPCVAGPIVDELQGNTCSTTVTFRDGRISGKAGKSQKIMKKFNALGFRGAPDSTISVTDSFLGLTPLAGEANAPVHVYFVHGLGGHAFNTWSFDVPSNKIESLKAWPRDFLPGRLSEEAINARIHTLGYNANIVKNAAPNATIDSLAEDILSALYGGRNEVHPREIYFVCHSLGGLIVCQALNMVLSQAAGYPTNPKYRDLFVRDSECIVKGIVLMGTPLRGSGHATLFAPYIKIIKQLNQITSTNDSLIKSLNGKQPIEISDIVHRFQTVIQEREIELVICCEETPVYGTQLTTTDESAKAIFSKSVIVVRVHNDHRNMVKFDDKSNGDYKNLENHIVRIMRPKPRQSKTIGAIPEIGQSSFIPLNHASIHDVQDQRLGKDFQHKPGGFSGAQGEHLKSPYSRQQTFSRDHLKERDPSSFSSNRLSNGFTKLNLGPGRHDSILSRASTVVNERNGTDDVNIFNRLKMFDTVFVVDDTGSMQQPAHDDHPEGQDRWSATKEALQHITALAAAKDEDGIDIRFLQSEELNESHILSVEKVMEILERVDTLRGGGTFLEPNLKAEIDLRLENYREYCEHDAAYKRKNRPPKKLNLIVITDGQADDTQEVEDLIVETARELDRLRAPSAQIGIQFVQIGEDEKARKYLKRLDDDLKRQVPPIRDIVDTTRCDSELSQGSKFQEVLEQVLLGAITRDVDERNNVQA